MTAETVNITAIFSLSPAARLWEHFLLTLPYGRGCLERLPTGLHMEACRETALTCPCGWGRACRR